MQVHTVAAITVHNHYDSDHDVYDIALIKLRQAVNLNSDFSKAICLPDKSEDFAGMTCTVTGWGALHEGEYVMSVVVTWFVYLHVTLVKGRG